jgi:ribosomal protein S6
MKESNENSLIIDDMNIQNKIYTIRGFQVMLDSDLAQLYGVETKRINEAVKNNPDKFPNDFYFEATDDELENFRSKFSTSSWGGNRYSPKLFTEQGIYMLATILKSKVATDITVKIIRTFANMRSLIKANDFYIHQLKELEKRQLSYEIKSDEKFDRIIDNYIDDTTLILFSKNQNIKIKIYTATISKQLQLDIKKYNQQYNNTTILK